MATNKHIEQLKQRIDQLVIQRDHWKQLAENRNSIVVTEVCQESRSVEEYIIDADSVRASWRLIRGYREQIEALRPENERLCSERDALRAELAAVKGQEAVATIDQGEPYEDGTPNPCKTLRWAGNNAEDDLPAGTKLYAIPPASPDVDGLVKALEVKFPLLDDNGLDETIHHCEWAIQQERKRLHAAISTWRQGQGKP